jgi:hypothetical protein
MATNLGSIKTHMILSYLLELFFGFLQLCSMGCHQTIVGAGSVIEPVVRFFQLCLTVVRSLLGLFLAIEWIGPRKQPFCRFLLLYPMYDNICILVVGLNTTCQSVDLLNCHVFNTEVERFFYHSHRLRQEATDVDDSGLVHKDSTLSEKTFSRTTNGRASYFHRGETHYIRYTPVVHMLNLFNSTIHHSLHQSPFHLVSLLLAISATRALQDADSPQATLDNTIL